MGAPVIRPGGSRPQKHGAGAESKNWSQFETLFQASAPTLWCIAAGVVGDRTLADDVLQEAALIAMRKYEEFDPTTSFTAWVGRIVRFVAMNAVRKRARRKAIAVNIDPADLDRLSRGKSAARADIVDHQGELSVDQKEFDDAVVAALMSLRPTARACLLLRTVQELPYHEIAQALGIPDGTAMSHVHRSRMTLRRLAGSSKSIER